MSNLLHFPMTGEKVFRLASRKLLTSASAPTQLKASACPDCMGSGIGSTYEDGMLSARTECQSCNGLGRVDDREGG